MTALEIVLEPHEFFLIARQRLGLTQAELAKVLGVERRSIVRYETSGAAIPEEIWTEIKQLAKDPEAAWADIEGKLKTLSALRKPNETAAISTEGRVFVAQLTRDLEAAH